MTDSLDSPEHHQHFALLRRELVEYLERSGIKDRRVLRAMNSVPRELFIPEHERRLAYNDRALAIGCRQTISQPYTVAFMCQAMQLHGTERVLEIGTGSGYNAAILSQLAAEVYSVERYAHLAEQATQRLQGMGYRNIQIMTSDGTLGWPNAAPFDVITVTAAARALPQPYVEQLVDGGRIIIPIGPLTETQRMYRFTKRADRVVEENLGKFQFVPLIGEHGWSDEEATMPRSSDEN